ncbi:beta-L-arabinofuranosidase domain-containing protein [Streptomyces mirabilis]
MPELGSRRQHRRHALSGVVECQDTLGAGYVGGQVERGAFELGGAWVPWYNLHKLSAGLLDAHGTPVPTWR